MQKVAKNQLLAPGICTLCESAPVEGQDVVDTLKDLVTGFPFKLAGRKYVCESCIVSLGNVVGLVSSEQADKAKRLAFEAEAKLNAVKDHVAEFAKKFADEALNEAALRAPDIVARAAEEVAETKAAAAPKKTKKAANAPAADSSAQE